MQHLVHLFEVVELQAAEEVLDSMPDRYQESVCVCVCVCCVCIYMCACFF